MENEKIFDSKSYKELCNLGWILCDWNIFNDIHFKFSKQDAIDNVYLLIEDHIEDEGANDYILYSWMDDIDDYNHLRHVTYGLDTRELKAALEFIEVCKKYLEGFNI